MPFVKINLLPPRVREARAKRLMIATGVVIGVVILTAPTGWWYSRFSALATLDARLASVKQDAKQFGPVIKMNERLDQEETALASKLSNLKKKIDGQARSIRILEMISLGQAQAQDLWLTSVQTRMTKKTARRPAGLEVTIKGMSFSVASFDEFLKVVRESDLKPAIEPKFEFSGAGGMAGRSLLKFTATLFLKV